MPSTPAIPLPHDEDALRWARTVLAAPAEASAEQVQRIVLSRLEEMEFVPPAQWEQAILLLAEDPPQTLWQRDLGYEMYRAREVALQAQVSQFATEFFSLPPDERRLRWRELTAACVSSRPLTAWLESLREGLEVVPPHVDHKNKLTRELADYLCRFFPLSPTLRIAVDEEFLHRASYTPAVWQKSALSLRKCYPQIARLAPQLIKHLCNFVEICRAEKKAEAKRLQEQARTATKGRQPAGGRNWYWLVPLLVIIGANLIRGLDNTNNRPNLNSSRSSWNSPQLNYNNHSNYAHDSMPDPTKPIEVESLSPEGVPPNLLKKANVGGAIRKMMNIPSDADVYFDRGNKVIYQQKAPETHWPSSNNTSPTVVPGGGVQPKVIFENGKVIIQEKESSPVDRILNSHSPSQTPSPYLQPHSSNTPGGQPFP